MIRTGRYLYAAIGFLAVLALACELLWQIENRRPLPERQRQQAGLGAAPVGPLDGESGEHLICRLAVILVAVLLGVSDAALDGGLHPNVGDRRGPGIERHATGSPAPVDGAGGLLRRADLWLRAGDDGERGRWRAGERGHNLRPPVPCAAACEIGVLASGHTNERAPQGLPPDGDAEVIDGVLVAIFGSRWQEALAVAWCESRLDPQTIGSYGERGLFQIHTVHAPKWPDFYAAWDDPWRNAEMAYEISGGGTDWSAWACQP